MRISRAAGPGRLLSRARRPFGAQARSADAVVLPPAWLIALVTSAALLAIFLHGPLLDLHIYRLGSLSARYGGQDLYSMRDAASGLPFTYTPFAAFAFAPLAVISERAAGIVITLATVAAAVRISGLVAHFLLERPAHRRLVAGLLLAAAAVSEPVTSTLLFGQIDMLTLAAAAEVYLRPRSRWGPITLGIVAGIKLTPAIFIAGLFAVGRWRDGLKASAAALATVVVGAVYLPHATAFFFGGAGFDDTRVGGVSYLANQSINGALWRLLGPGGSRPAWFALSAVVIIGATIAARRLFRRGDVLGAFAAIALAGLLASPVSWIHHWTALIVVQAALLRPVLRGSRPIWRARTVMVVFWFLLSKDWLLAVLPHGENQEYRESWPQYLVGNLYLWLGLVSLGMLLAEAFRFAKIRGTPPESPNPTKSAAAVVRSDP